MKSDKPSCPTRGCLGVAIFFVRGQPLCWPCAKIAARWDMRIEFPKQQEQAR